jgi:ferrochelatase
MARTAVVLFNLGGPDGPAAIRPFLFNLFSDPAILGVPQPFRWLLAQAISRRRAPKAKAIYDLMGGGSPLLPLTEDQARALETALGGEAKAFIAMRYWHPMTDAAAAAVKAWGPDQVVLLPLYPQFSTTTTGSSLTAWARAARAVGLAAPTRVVCCYPSEPGFVAATAEAIRPALERAARRGKPRLLFSAHGLPKKVVDAGDPYQWQVERSAAAVVEALGLPGLDWLVSYQSKVGPLQWLGPATDDEVRRAGRAGVPLVVVPIAFVSEHSETLVELDIEYRHLAESVGVPAYERVPAVATAPAFIQGLAGLVRRALAGDGVVSESGGRICPGGCRGCAQGEGR